MTHRQMDDDISSTKNSAFGLFQTLHTSTPSSSKPVFHILVHRVSFGIMVLVQWAPNDKGHTLTHEHLGNNHLAWGRHKLFNTNLRVSEEE